MQLPSVRCLAGVIAGLSLALSLGCGGGSEHTASGDGEAATTAEGGGQLDPRLDGTWVVTEWTTHKGDFPGGRGRRFIFDGASLTKHNEDGSDETQFRLIPAGEGDDRGFAMRSELDFDEDGEPDMVFVRHALYRVDDEKLQISQGTINAQIDLSDPSSSSPQESSLPTSWEATPDNDIVILERADAAS